MATFETSVIGLGKLIIQDLDGVEKPVQLITGKRADICIDEAHSLGSQSQSDSKRKEHIAAFAPYMKAESCTAELIVDG
jgi:hypothetical protein